MGFGVPFPGSLVEPVVNVVNGLNQTLLVEFASIGGEPETRSPVFRADQTLGERKTIPVAPSPAARIVPLPNPSGYHDQLLAIHCCALDFVDILIAGGKRLAEHRGELPDSGIGKIQFPETLNID